MAANRGGYKSDAALRRTRETPTPFSAPCTVNRAEYDAVLEYSCALKAENTELKSGGGDNVTAVSTLEAASDANETTTGLLAEMRMVHAAQMREMTALVAAATDINAPAPPHREGKAQAQIHTKPAGTRRVRYPPPRGVKTTGVDRNGRAFRTCRNCTKKWVIHADKDCLKLATNKGNQKAGWTSYFM